MRSAAAVLACVCAFALAPACGDDGGPGGDAGGDAAGDGGGSACAECAADQACYVSGADGAFLSCSDVPETCRVAGADCSCFSDLELGSCTCSAGAGGQLVVTCPTR